MNLLLLKAEELIEPQMALIQGARLRSVLENHQLSADKRFRVGVLNGATGWGQIIEQDSLQLRLQIELGEDVPQLYPVHLVVGISRPQTVKKVLHLCASSGVKTLAFVRSERAEKSYFQSPVLNPDAIQEELWKGLEQGENTVLPSVQVFDRFLSCLDSFSSLEEGEVRLLADTQTKFSPPRTLHLRQARKVVLCIGPEAGWSSFERDKFLDSGFKSFSLGRFTLRVEFAAAAALGYVVQGLTDSR